MAVRRLCVRCAVTVTPAVPRHTGPVQGQRVRDVVAGAVLAVVTLLVAAAVLLLLKKRADGARFRLPFGDGTMILAAGAWSGLLIAIRVFDRPLGQGLLALACAAMLIGAGLRERAKRPPDDIPTERLEPRS